MASLFQLFGEAQANEYEKEHIDPSLTPKNVVSALRELSSEWKFIGGALQIPKEIMSQIDADGGNDSCLFAVIMHWMNKNCHCSWDDIVEIVTFLNNAKYNDTVLSNIDALQKRFGKQQDKSLQKGVIEPGNLDIKVGHVHLKDIILVLMECCPLRWHEIGLHLGSTKSLLDTIDVDEQDTYRKLLAMLSTWINSSEIGTLRELVNVLKKLKENKAAEDIIKEFDVNMTIPPRMKHQIIHDDSYQFDERKKEQLKKKKSIMRDLRGLLKVPHNVSNEDLFDNMARYIKHANLSREELQKVVRIFEALEKCMTESSTVLKDWAKKLKEDLLTIRTIKKKIHMRQMDLEKIQNRLDRNKEILQQQLHLYQKKTFFQNLTAYNVLQEKLQTERKLNFVQEELERLVRDLEWANTDYKEICATLNRCQVELEACIEEMCRFQDAISSSLPIFTPSTTAGVGGAVGGVMGSLGGTFGAIVGTVLGAGVGGVVGAVASVVNSRNQNRAAGVPHVPEQNRELKRLVDSCARDISDNKHEIQNIQKLLNDVENPLDTS